MTEIVDTIQHEIRVRQSRSDSISCPPFFQVVNTLVNPSKEYHRSSHSRSHSKQKKSTSVSSPRSTFSDVSIDDASSVYTKSSAYPMKLESVLSTGGLSPRSDFSVNSPVFTYTPQGKVCIRCFHKI